MHQEMGMAQLKTLKKAERGSRKSGLERYKAGERELERILFGDPHEDWADTEKKLISEISDVFPEAPDHIKRAALRILIGFVTSPHDLLCTTVPMHMIILKNYHWGEPNSPSEAEGAGFFWMFGATNDVLETFEERLNPLISGFFIPNMFRFLAMRSWIRIQSVYMDTTQTSKLIEIAQEHAFETHNIFKVSARYFVDGLSAIEASTQTDQMTSH